MARVFGIHEIDVNPGINEVDFKKFFVNELAPIYKPWKFMLLKGDRGQRTGKYAVLIEIESVEERDLHSPAPNTFSEEDQRWEAEHKDLVEALMKKWAKFSTTDIGMHAEYTDYIVLE